MVDSAAVTGLPLRWTGPNWCDRNWDVTSTGNRKAKVMKTRVAAILLSAVLLGSIGCSTPAYSGMERAQIIKRGWIHDWAQLQDDIDHLLLLRPASKMSVWNATVQHME
mgnify:CR=1 FL=1